MSITIIERNLYQGSEVRVNTSSQNFYERRKEGGQEGGRKKELRYGGRDGWREEQRGGGKRELRNVHSFQIHLFCLAE